LRFLDRLLPHKTKLERHLKERYGELFGAEFDVLLYDLTTSYVEGQVEENPLMQYGYSRDHRSDSKQVVLALVVNPEGFPLSYETFDGDRTDVTTLEAVMRMVERKYGRPRRVWVFDRGIVSEENLASLRKRRGQYWVGTPRSKLKTLERNHSALSPAQALALLATLQSADIVLPTTDGRELRLRRITAPSPEQKQLLHQLQITLPEQLKIDLERSENLPLA